VKERDAAAAAIDPEVFAGVVPQPMQTQVQRMGGMSSAVIGGFWVLRTGQTAPSYTS
jgi:hypothetical protein